MLKSRLEEMAAAAGLRTKSAIGHGERFQVANRIASEELEAWFFGDWEAVQAAYPRVSAAIPQKAGFRGGTWEAMERVLRQAGYFGTGLRKLELARSVVAQMVIDRSRSFQAFAAAVSAARACGR